MGACRVRRATRVGGVMCQLGAHAAPEDHGLARSCCRARLAAKPNNRLAVAAHSLVLRGPTKSRSGWAADPPPGDWPVYSLPAVEVFFLFFFPTRFRISACPANTEDLCSLEWLWRVSLAGHLIPNNLIMRVPVCDERSKQPRVR